MQESVMVEKQEAYIETVEFKVLLLTAMDDYSFKFAKIKVMMLTRWCAMI